MGLGDIKQGDNRNPGEKRALIEHLTALFLV